MEILKVKKIKPLADVVITTKDVYEEDYMTNGIITANKGDVKPYQKVIAVGTLVRNIKEGDMVYINPIRYAVKKHKPGSLKDGVITDNPVIGYEIPEVTIDEINYFYLSERDISYVIEEYEKVKVETKIALPKEKKIIIPKKGIIL